MVWEAESWEWKISGGLGTLEMQRKGLREDLWGFEGFIRDLGNEEEEIEDGLEYISVLFEPVNVNLNLNQSNQEIQT